MRIMEKQWQGLAQNWTSKKKHIVCYKVYSITQEKTCKEEAYEVQKYSEHSF